MMHRTFVAALGAAVLALAGCGGDDPEKATRPVQFSKPPSGPLTKAQYIAAADTICRESAQASKPYRDKLDALDSSDGPEDAAPLIHDSVAQARKGVDRLRALKAPKFKLDKQGLSEDKVGLQGYLTSRSLAVRYGESFEKAARSSDVDEIKRILDADALLINSQMSFAKSYGFKDCGRDPSLVSPADRYADVGLLE